MNKAIVIVPGEPSGVGPEITIGALRELFAGGFAQKVVVFFDENTLSRLAAAVGPLNEMLLFNDKSFFSDFMPGKFFYIPVAATDEKSVAVTAIRNAADFCLEKPGGRIMVTGPINKCISNSCIGSPLGHTEILSLYTGGENLETVFCLDGLKVFFLSRHLSLAEALKLVRKDNILKAIRSMYTNMKILGCAAPRLGIAGLNPHAGDNGLFGREEKDEIYPAVMQALTEGIDVTGPIGADSVFFQGFSGRFDAVLSLYHDQGHIALKSRDFFATVTMTLGMPFLRTSVDHGTAEDIAWKGMAKNDSMVNAILLAEKLLF